MFFQFFKDNAMIQTEDKIIKTEIPQLKAPTIVGKIDLDAINTKVKPKKKTHAQLTKEKEDRFRIEQEQRQALKQARRTARQASLDSKKAEEIEKRKQDEIINTEQEKQKSFFLSKLFSKLKGRL